MKRVLKWSTMTNRVADGWNLTHNPGVVYPPLASTPHMYIITQGPTRSTPLSITITYYYYMRSPYGVGSDIFGTGIDHHDDQDVDEEMKDEHVDLNTNVGKKRRREETDIDEEDTDVGETTT